MGLRPRPKTPLHGVLTSLPQTPNREGQIPHNKFLAPPCTGKITNQSNFENKIKQHAAFFSRCSPIL